MNEENTDQPQSNLAIGYAWISRNRGKRQDWRPITEAEKSGEKFRVRMTNGKTYLSRTVPLFEE